MLFDLSGKRRNVIKVIYATLAILMGGSLVLFGIGSDAPGGILDALGLGGGSSSNPSNPQYEEQIDNAEERLETNPNDERALLALVRYHYLSGQEQFEVDPETGFGTPTEEATAEFGEALDAWDRYLETKPKRPDAGVATNVAYISDVLFNDALTNGDAAGALAEAERAVEAYRIATESDPSAPDFGALATYLYVTGETEAAEAAAARAIELSDESSRETVEQRLDQTAKQATKLNEQLEAFIKRTRKPGEEPAAGGALENPFGGLSGTPSPIPTQP